MSQEQKAKAYDEAIHWPIPEQLRKAVEIEREEIIEKACAWFRTLDDKEPPYKTTEEFIEGFLIAMKQ